MLFNYTPFVYLTLNDYIHQALIKSINSFKLFYDLA